MPWSLPAARAMPAEGRGAPPTGRGHRPGGEADDTLRSRGLLLGDGRVSGRVLGVSLLLTLASALPVTAAAVPAMHAVVRWNVPERLPSEIIRGALQRDGVSRLSVVARSDGRARATGAQPADGSARTGRNGPPPPPVAHRARSSNPVTVDGQEQDDGARRRLPGSWAALSRSARGRLGVALTREIVRAVAVSARDSVFHEAHAPPVSSFVASRS